MRAVDFIAKVLGGAMLLASLLAVCAWWVATPDAIDPAPSRVGELDGVVLVEPGVSRREAQRLVLDGGRVGAVRPARSATSEFSGLFLLPGLADTHLHMPMMFSLPGDQEYTALLLLAHGVTSARLLGGTSAAEVASLRARIDRGEIPGPRISTCGLIIDGQDPVIPGQASVANAQQARELVDRLADEGVDCIKAYDKLSLESVVALREAAHARGLPAVGHTPQDVALEDARLDDTQHLRGVHPPFLDEGRVYPEYLRPWLRMDEARLQHVIEVSREHGMAYTPTLVAVESMPRARDWATWSASATMQAWPSHLREAIFSGEIGLNPGRFMSDEQAEMLRKAFATMQRTTRALHDAGVRLHTGTDANAPNVVPGFSLHRELSLWVDAGIPAEATLAAATLRSPETLGRVDPDRSAFDPGQPADFALFAEDPTRDIAALSSLVAVVADGRLYRRAELDARLARHAAHYESASYRAFVVAPLRLLAGGVTLAMQLRADDRDE